MSRFVYESKSLRDKKVKGANRESQRLYKKGVNPCMVHVLDKDTNEQYKEFAAHVDTTQNNPVLSIGKKSRLIPLLAEAGKYVYTLIYYKRASDPQVICFTPMLSTMREHSNRITFSVEPLDYIGEPACEKVISYADAKGLKMPAKKERKG